MKPTERRTWLKFLLTTGCVGPVVSQASSLTAPRQDPVSHPTILMPLASSHQAVEACIEAKRIHSDSFEEFLIHPLTEEAIKRPAHALKWMEKYPNARVVALVDDRASVIFGAMLNGVPHTILFDSHAAPTARHDLLRMGLRAAGCPPTASALRMPEDNPLVCIAVCMACEQQRGFNS